MCFFLHVFYPPRWRNQRKKIIENGSRARNNNEIRILIACREGKRSTRKKPMWNFKFKYLLRIFKYVSK